MAEPDFAALPQSTPQPVRRLLRWCLEKDRDKRLHDIADARLDLEEAIAMPAAESVAGAMPSPRRAPRWWIVIGVAAVAAISVAGTLLVERSLHQDPAAAPAARFVVNPPPNAGTGQTQLPEVAITADGKTVVYVASSDRGPVLFGRWIDRLDGAAIPGVEPVAYAPFVSPDGRWVGYIHGGVRTGPNNTLLKVPIEGGPSVEIVKGMPMNGASWGPVGTAGTALDGRRSSSR